MRGPCTFKLRDAARALKAAELAGVAASLDILPDGTLRLTPTRTSLPPPEPPKDTQPGAPGLRAWD